MRSWWSKPESPPGLVFADKECNQSDFSIDHSVKSMCKAVSCVVGKSVFSMISVLSWQNSVNLCPVSFCTQRPHLLVTSGISWLPTFVFQFPMINSTSFFVCLFVLVLWTLVGLPRTDKLQFLWHRWLGHRLVLLWHWMVCLGNKSRSFCLFWVCTKSTAF